MQFQKFAINVTLAIAATISASSLSHASTKYDFLTLQPELEPIQPQSNHSKSQKSISTIQAGQTFFHHPPHLDRTAAFPNVGYVPSTYEFTLTVPEDAGQPLKAVTIMQRTNVETIEFDATHSRAFISKGRAMGSEIQLASIGGNQPAHPGEVTIVFEQPVQPGTTVTIALAARRNPMWNGVYLFGVTAYPDGENGLGQFLGYGRLSFYGSSN
jgi:hypothetical protein